MGLRLKCLRRSILLPLVILIVFHIVSSSSQDNPSSAPASLGPVPIAVVYSSSLSASSSSSPAYPSSSSSASSSPLPQLNVPTPLPPPPPLLAPSFTAPQASLSAPSSPSPAVTVSPVTASTGLLSSELSTLVNHSTTTVYTRKVYGTYIGDLYAHYAQTESHTITPEITATPTSSVHLTPASIIHSTEVNALNSDTTVHTTEIYTTHISGFPAQFTRSTFNIIDDKVTSSMSTSSIISSKSHPHLHFPSPLRSRHKQPQTVSPSSTSIAVITSTEIVTTTVTATASLSVPIDVESKSKQASTYDLHTLIKSSNSNTSTVKLDYSIDEVIATSSRTDTTRGGGVGVGVNNDETAPLDYPADSNEAEYEENESSFEEEKALPGHISRHRSSREENSGPAFVDEETVYDDNYDGRSFVTGSAAPAIRLRDFTAVGGLNGGNSGVSGHSSPPSSSSSGQAIFGQRVSGNARSSINTGQSDGLLNGRSRHTQSPHARHPPVDPVSPVSATSLTSQRQGSNHRSRNFASSSSRFQSGPGVILTKEEPEDSTFEIRTSTSQRQAPNIGMSNGGRRSRIEVPPGDSPVNGARATSSVSSVAFTSSSSASSSQKYNRINGPNGNSRRGTHSRTGRNGITNRSRAPSSLLHHTINLDHDETDSIVSGGIYPSNSAGNSNNNGNYNSANKRLMSVNNNSGNNNGVNGRRRGQSGRTVKTIILAPSTDAVEERLMIAQLTTTPTPHSSLPTWSAPPKTTLTVTSIATWVKTLPIRHGFKTSYATITTQGFNTSVIKPDQYQITLDPTDTSKLITQVTQDVTSIDAAGVHTKIIVTTTDLSEIKLVPIRVGYSTRTDTSTSSYIITTLQTLYSTPPLPPAYTLLTETVSTTATITSTSISSLVLGGKTLLSTLTSSSLQETTIVTTRTIPLGFFGATVGPTLGAIESTIVTGSGPVSTISPSTVAPASPRSLFTTLITFQITDDQGDITKLVTPVTLPVDAIVHKVASRAAKLEAIDTVTRGVVVGGGGKINATLASSFLSSVSSSSPLDHTLPQSDLIPSPPNDPNRLLALSSSSPLSHNPHDDRRAAASTNAKIITAAAATAKQLQSKVAPSASHVPLLSASFSSSPSLPLSFNEQIMSNTRSSLHFLKGSTSENHNNKRSALLKSPLKHKKATSTVKEDKYTVNNFKQRRLQQFNLANDNSDDFSFGPSAQSPGSETFFRDFGRVVPLPQTSSQFAPSSGDSVSSSGLGGPASSLVPAFDSAVQLQPPVNNFGGRQPTFQRLKVTPGNNPFARLPVQSAPSGPAAPPPPPPPPQAQSGNNGNQVTFANGFAPSGDNSPFTRFHRLVSTKPEIPLRTTTNFRRVPVFGNQLPPSIPSGFNAQALPPAINTVTLPPQVPTSPPNPSVQPQSIPIPGSNEFTNQPASNKPFRRVRPNQGSNQPSNGATRRNRPNRVQTESSFASEPVTTIPPPVTTFKSLLVDSDTSDVTTITPVTIDPRRLVRIRRPPNSGSGSRRRVVVRPQSTPNSIRIPANNEPAVDDEKLNNSVDVDTDLVGSVFGSRVLSKDETPSSSNVLPVTSARVTRVPSSPLPLTYLTTYTYLTTVLRGPHTLVTSRLSTESSISTEILDDSEVAMLGRPKILPTQTVNIGSRTKGPTTTIVNVQSEVRATYVTSNNQQIQPSVTAAVSSVIRPTVSIHRKPVIEAPVTSELNSPQQTIGLDQLNKVPKSYFTKYTYFYTVVDGSATRKSTRSETVSSRVDTPVNFAELNIKPTVTNGLLSIGSGAETVHLGRRSFGKSTTEVNLAMETYLQLEGITNAVIESVPTLLPNSPHEPTSSLPDTSILLSSVGQDESTTVQPTPDIPSRGGSTRISSRIRGSAGAIRSSGVINVSPIRSDILRSRVVVSSRPLRVRVRQSSRIVSPAVSPSVESVDILSSSSPGLIEPSSSSSLQPLETSSDIFASELISPTPVVDLEGSASTDAADDTSKRRVAVTVRRPFGGLNRLRTRTRGPIRDQVTTSPDNALITPSETVKESVVSSSRVPLNRLRVASRVFKPHLHSISLNPNEHPEPPIEVPSSAVETVTPSSSVPILPSGSLSGSTDSLESAGVSPSTVIITYFTTTTHTVPFTVGDKTLYTTFEMTNTRIATETIDPSAGLRGVTSSMSPSDATESISPSNSDQPLETKTMFTTFTFFTTFFTGDTSTVKSSEKVISNIIAVPLTSSPVLPPVINPTGSLDIPLDVTSLYSSSTSLPEYTSSPVYTALPSTESPSLLTPSPSPSPPSSSHVVSSSTSREDAAVIVTETTEKIDVSTIYSTQTFYATLYNGNTSTITPIEETKTELLTLREPVKVTRTIWPDGHVSSSAASSTFSKTYFTTHTSLVTLVSDNQIVTTPIEQVTSSVITFTIAPTSTKPFKYPSSTVIPILDQSQPKFTVDPSLLTTRATHTTLTHYITLYSGTNTVLSSVTEISPTIVTEAVSFTPYREFNNDNGANGIDRVQTSKNHDASNNNLLTSFSPSISTLLTTHTYFTTLFSGTTSFVSSRADVTSSLVTLYVPAVSITPSAVPTSVAPTTSSVELNPSLISSSSDSTGDTVASGVNEKVLDDLRSQILSMASSSAPADDSIAPSSIDTSSSDQTVLFTDHIMPSSSSPSSDSSSEVTSDGPNDTTVKVPSRQPDSVTESSDSTSKSTSGSVVDLEDILSGSGKINGNLGAAIKDIVSLFASKETNGKLANSNTNNPDAENGKTPQPVYVPPQNERTTESVITMPNEPDLEPVFKPESSMSEVTQSPVQSNTVSLNSRVKSMMIPSAIATPSLPATRLMDSTSRAVFSQVGAGATTIFFGDADANVSPTLHISGSVQPTRYVTSVESSTRTLTLTTTKVYYTRDSPLTITSVLTTVIPPKTFVSTIIGSRTILGTAGEATRTQVTGIQATETLPEATTTITTTTLIFNSITTTVVRTLVIPNEIAATKPMERTLVTRTPSSAKPTRKPLVSVRTTSKTTPPPVAIKPSSEGTNKKRKPLPKPSLPVELEAPISRGSSKPISKAPLNTTAPVKPVKTSRVPIVEDDQCSPGCNTANKEICIEDNGKYKCDCRPGYSRKDATSQCKETNNFVLLLRVMKLGESEVIYNKDLSNSNSGEYKKLAKMTKDEINKVYTASEGLKSNFLGVDVTRIAKNLDDEEGILVNLTVRVMHDEKINEDLLREELAKNLEEAESLPVPAMISAEVEDVMDFDECSDPQYNDCSPAAKCINEPGSYTCRCKGIFTDLDPVNPGRSCASEVKMCDLCNGRGDCYRDETADMTACKCHRMYIGRYCEINGILLATLLPVAAILSIISVCCIVYCCRKYRKRTTISKGFRNIAQFGPPTIGAGTLDRKAMLGQETSSENSDHYRGHHHPAYEGGNHHASMDPESNDSTPRRRRGSEPNIDRLPGQVAAAYPSNLPPQVVIPRARHPNQSGSSDEIVPVPAPGKYRRSASRSDLIVNENPSLDKVSPHAVATVPPSVLASMSMVPPPPAALTSGKKRWPPTDAVSVKSKASRMDYGANADLMNFWSPPDETMSMPSSHKKRVVSSKNAPWEWQGHQSGHPVDRETRRPPSPVASYVPGGNIATGATSHRDIRGAMSEAARSYNESIQFAPTKSRPPRFVPDSAEMRRGYARGWRGNMIPERAESEVSYTTSFLTSGHRFPYPIGEDGLSVVSRRSYFSNANWGTLPFGEEE